MPRFLQMRVVVPCALLSILVGSLSAAAAVAAPTDDPPSRRVYFGDLDLNRSTGVATLYSRIIQAAREVCNSNDSWGRNCSRSRMSAGMVHWRAPCQTSILRH